MLKIDKDAGQISMTKKDFLLGQPHGTAVHKLRKKLLFSFAQETGRDVCYRCHKLIESVDTFSIEHKESWQLAKNPIESFFDLNNIAYSHLDCNRDAALSSRGVIRTLHGTSRRYNAHGCRCDKCKKAKAIVNKKYR